MVHLMGGLLLLSFLFLDAQVDPCSPETHIPSVGETLFCYIFGSLLTHFSLASLARVLGHCASDLFDDSSLSPVLSFLFPVFFCCFQRDFIFISNPLNFQ